MFVQTGPDYFLQFFIYSPLRLLYEFLMFASHGENLKNRHPCRDKNCEGRKWFQPEIIYPINT